MDAITSMSSQSGQGGPKWPGLQRVLEDKVIPGGKGDGHPTDVLDNQRNQEGIIGSLRAIVPTKKKMPCFLARFLEERLFSDQEPSD